MICINQLALRTVEMSFVAELNVVAGEAPAGEVKRRSKEEVRDELFTALTEKYLVDVRESILRAAKKGYREKFINFDRVDFKANFPGLGTPPEVQRAWLKEMCDPESKYMLEDPEDGKKLTLEGIDADVWNNGKFTTVFKW